LLAIHKAPKYLGVFAENINNPKEKVMGYMDPALTEEQIDQLAEEQSTTNLGYKRVANRILREENGCAVVDKAIRRVNKLERANGAIEGLEYVYCVVHEITKIVNSQY
jgi:hypothetical protein